MKRILAVALVVAVLHLALCSHVTVTEGEYTFSLEDVKMLWRAMEETENHKGGGGGGGGGIARSSTPAVCSDPTLPDAFRPLCHDPNARSAFANLENLATRADSCELCESVACTGCSR